MAQPLASLAIELTANIAGFVSDLGRAQRESDQFGKRLEQRFNAIGATIGASLAVGITAVSAAVAKTVNEFDRIGDAARRLNVTTEALTGLGFAAQMSGSSIETLENGLGRLNRVIGDAANGNAAAAQLFERLGIDVRDAAGNVISADDAFAQIADRFREYRDDAAEVAIATQLFGRAAGPELRELLNRGSEGIDELREKAARLGVVIGGDAAEAAGQLQDSIDVLKAAGTGFTNGLTSALLPALAAFAERSAEATDKTGGFRTAGEKLGNMITNVAGFFVFGAAKVQQFGVIVGATVDVFLTFGRSLGQVAGVARLQFAAIAQAATGNIVGAADTMRKAQQAARDLATELGGQLTTKLDAARQSFDEIDASAERSIGALQNRLKSAGDQAGKTAAKIEECKKPVVELGGGAGKAAGQVDELAGSLADLGDPLRDAKSLLGRLAAEMAGPVERAAMRYRDQLVEIAQAQAALFAQGPPTAEMLAYFTALEEAAARAGEEYARIREEFAAGSDGIAGNGRETADDLTRSFEGFTDAASAAFADFVTGGIRSFRDFGDALQSIAQRFLADLVQQFLRTQLRLPAPGFAGGAGGASGGGFLGSLGGPAAAAGTRFGLGITGLSLAYSGFRSGNPLTGAAGGALTGFQVGGPVGAIIGGILGALAGAFGGRSPPDIRLGGVGNTRKPETTFSTALGQFQLGVRGGVDGSAVQRAVTDFDNAIAQMLQQVGVAADQFDRIRSSLQSLSLDLRGSNATPENVLRARFDAILATFDEATQAFVRQGTSLEDQVRRLGERLEFPRLLEELLAGLDPQPVRDQIQEINDYFDALVERARSLAATQEQLDRIEAARTRTLQELAEAQERARQSALNDLLGDLRFEDSIAGLSAAEQEMARINAQFDALRDRAIELGASQADLDVIERRRAAALRDVTDAVEEQTRALQEQVAAAREQIAATLEQLEFDDLVAGLEPLDAELARINRRFDQLREQIIAAAAEFGDAIDVTAQLARLEDLRTRALERAAAATRDQTEALQQQAAAFNGAAQQISFNFEQLFAAIGQLPDPEQQSQLRDLLRQLMSGTMDPFSAGNALSQILAAIGDLPGSGTLEAAARRLRDLQSAAQGVADFLNRQLLGTSSLSPAQRLAEAQRQFNEIARRAAGGDIDAIRAIGGNAQAFLDQAAQFFGVGSAEFRGIEAYIRDVLDPIAGITTAQSLPEAMSDLTLVLARLVEVLGGQSSGPGSLPEAVSSALQAVLRDAAIVSDQALRDAIAEAARLARST